MKFSTPRFWFEKKGFVASILQPFAVLYAALGNYLRSRITPQKMRVPVICVGNVVVGGSGKTPIVRLLAKRLQMQGFTPHIISRGYGGYLKGPIRVDAATHTIGEVGDEPLLLSAIAPVWVAKNKVAGAQAAIAAGATVLLLDDGLQNPTLHKDVSFLVVDATRGLGNGCVIPAGPLRETLHESLSKTTAVIWVGNGNDEILEELTAQKPVVKASAKTISQHDVNGQKVLAFCGLGNTQKFYDGVKALGAEIVKTTDFPDHYVWSTYEIRALLDEAKTLNARAVTTAKDAVRIPPSLRDQIIICDVEISFSDETALDKQLRLAKS